MAATSLLGTNIAAQCAQSVREITQSGFNALSDQNADTLRRLIDDIAVCTQAALIDVARDFNATTMAARIPEELWLDIWCHLPMDDRIHASHVCSAWRETALGSPRLWSTIELQWWRGKKRWGRTNLWIVKAIIPRTADHAIHLSIDTHWASGSNFQELADFLKDIWNRIVSFELLVESYGSLKSVGTYFSDMPLLHTLVVRLSKRGYYGDDKWHRGGPSYPKLRRLEIHGAFENRVFIQTTTPTLATLITPFVRASELLRQLEAAPNLQSLDLTCTPRGGLIEDRVGADCWDEVSGATARISNVTIRKISEGMQAAILSMFRVDSNTDSDTVPRRQLSLHYTLDTEYTSACCIFTDLGGPVRLSLHREGKMLVVHGVGACQRERHVRGSFTAFNTLAANLVGLRVGALVIDLDLLIAMEAQQPCWRGLEELTIRLPVPLNDVALDPLSPSLPALKVLRLEAQSCTVMSASRLRDIACRFLPDRGLNGLVLHRITTVDDEVLKDTSRMG